MKFIDILKKMRNKSDRVAVQKNTTPEKVTPERACPSCTYLSKYEIRRQEITNSTGIISGIFYIYDGEIIPDYYSETIQPKFEDERSNERYHSSFFNNYMRKKYPALSDKRENSIPRGRIEANVKDSIFIDQCYADDEKTIKKICELYRICIDDFLLISNLKYSCDNCRGKNI